MCGLMWVFCEWANKIKARKFVPQHSSVSSMRFLCDLSQVVHLQVSREQVANFTVVEVQKGL